MPQKVLNNDYATLYFHDDERIIHHVFEKPIGGDAFREILNAGVDLLAETRATKWLSDDRNNGIISDEDTQWVVSDWLIRARDAGWKSWALVLPEEILARVDMSKFVDMVHDLGVHVFLFTDPDEGMEWLRNR